MVFDSDDLAISKKYNAGLLLNEHGCERFSFAFEPLTVWTSVRLKT